MAEENEFGYLRSAHRYITRASTIIETDKFLHVFNREQLKILNTAIRYFYEMHLWNTKMDIESFETEVYRINPNQYYACFWQQFYMYDFLDLYDDFSDDLKKTRTFNALMKKLEEYGITIEKFKNNRHEVTGYLDYCDALKEQGMDFYKKYKK